MTDFREKFGIKLDHKKLIEDKYDSEFGDYRDINQEDEEKHINNTIS